MKSDDFLKYMFCQKLRSFDFFRLLHDTIDLDERKNVLERVRYVVEENDRLYVMLNE